MREEYIDKIDKELERDIREFRDDEDLIDILSQIFKSLSDPTRLKIIYALSKGELCVSDISLLLDMSQSSISHQLAFLRGQRLIKVRRIGRRAYYSLDDEHVFCIFKDGIDHAMHKL
ncbi:DNA-binding transcriptional ArsR family regulator [Peptoniphilus olsenii]|uniref:DNA-binding transcriptional ArsR family regulator n=1 Tax=Peptoniphilus olsenii TaxID=411570 RepID=A0ABV2JA41_9FIRM